MPNSFLAVDKYLRANLLAFFTLLPTTSCSCSLRLLYNTTAKRIRITKSVADPNAPKSANDIAEEILYLEAEVSKGSPYLNEAVTVLYKLYISPSVSVTNFKPLDLSLIHI